MSEADAALMKRLEHRTERLLRTLRASRGAVLKPVIAMMVAHVAWTAIALCGEQLRDALWEYLLRAVRGDEGLCIICGERLATVEGVCQPCEDDGQREDAQFKFDELKAEGAKH